MAYLLLVHEISKKKFIDISMNIDAALLKGAYADNI